MANIPDGCSDDGSICDGSGGGGVAGDDRPGVGVCSGSD